MHEQPSSASVEQQLSDLLGAALNLPPERREAWLQTLPADYEPLKARLRDLLAQAAKVETGDFLDTLPKIRAPREMADAAKAGDIVGAYRLLRELGSGGMASVWQAERVDGLIGRPLALKLPHGTWRRGELGARMAREREILAGLDHPNIAHLYDAGLDARGQPFLAIEYVDGIAIDHYCGRGRLGLGARLELFLQVANAVAYAHANLVIHRDLKPANILVTRSGQVKLLDFGIAKMLEAGEAKATRLTRMEGQVLTPEYASPEQIRGEPLTIASDIYSLGVILYELLSGARPYRLERDSRGALEEAILQLEPRRPSEVAPAHARRALRGDLDTIALQCLKKRVESRYATVNALVADVEAHLQDRPVRAQPDSAWYRAKKLVIRNKGAVSAAAAVLVALVIGIVIATWQARVAVLEKARAEQAKELIASLFEGADPYREGGGAVTAAELLKEARRRVDANDMQPAMRLELLNVIASSLLNLDDFDSAEEIARTTLAEALRTLGPTHAQTLRARTHMMNVHRFRGRTDEMRRELEQIQDILKRTGGGSVPDRVSVAESEAHLSIDEGKYAEAVASATRAYTLAERHFGADSPRTAVAAMLLAESYEYSDATPAEALKWVEQAFQLCVRAYGKQGKHPRIIDARQIRGRALARAGQLGRGVAEMEQAAADAASVFGPESSTVGFFLGNLARYQRTIGKVQLALSNSTRSLEIHARNVDRNSYTYLGGVTARGVIWLAARRGKEGLDDLTESASGLATLFDPEHEETVIARFNRGIALAYLGRAKAGEQEVREVLDIYRRKYSEPAYRPHRPLQALGSVQRLGGDFAAALATQEEVQRQIGSTTSTAWDRAPVLAEIGMDQLGLGQPQRALDAFEEAFRLYEEVQLLPSPARTDILVGLGRARLALGRAADALAPLEEADAFWRDFDAENRWAGEAALWLGRCYVALGRKADADAALTRAERILVRSLIPADAALVALARERGRRPD
jgi:eukaryotic-like serine/threonine-protein kinase